MQILLPKHPKIRLREVHFQFVNQLHHPKLVHYQLKIHRLNRIRFQLQILHSYQVHFQVKNPHSKQFHFLVQFALQKILHQCSNQFLLAKRILHPMHPKTHLLEFRFLLANPLQKEHQQEQHHQ